MSSVMRDLWPDDIKCEDVISPEEILDHQARQLEARTNGLLAGHVVKTVGEDRVIVGFEVEVVRADTRVRLFEVQHRLEFEYPAGIVPPDERLPDFLKDRVYSPTTGEIISATAKAVSNLTGSGKWIANKWIASSPTEFSRKVQDVLASPAVKGIVLSLLSRANQERRGSPEEENQS